MPTRPANRVLYTAVKRFDRASADWSRYVAWSGLTQLDELVSLDNMCCPTAFGDLTPEDWKHNVRA